MTEYSGASAIGTWVTATGTTSLMGNQRSVDYTPSVDMIETTAGTDGNKTYIAGPKDGQLSMTLLSQASGSALLAQFTEGQIGTITNLSSAASGEAFKTFRAICLGATQSWPYADVCTINVSWQQSGPRT